MTIAKPTQVATPFANSGLKNSIPQSATGSNLASLEEGFPAVTMVAVADGGTPPQGQDFNGILNQVTNQLRYSQAGGLYPYDATFCTAIGGYPLGAILMSADGSKLWQNQVAGNTNNPDSDDTNWIQMQDLLTFDATPTANSTNPVTSGGIKTALDGKLDKTGGTMTGQIVGANVGRAGSLSVQASSGALDAVRVKHTDGQDMSFGISETQNAGIYDNRVGAWVIMRNMDGDINIYARQKNGNNRTFSIPADAANNMTFEGRALEQVSESGNNYIRYLSGIQICWGAAILNSTNPTSVTFPKPFLAGTSNNFNYRLSSSPHNRATYYLLPNINGVNATGMSSISEQSVSWIAVGIWK